MIESKKKWTIERPNEEMVNKLSTELYIPTVHAKILVARGITNLEEAKAFLHMDESSVLDPYLLYDMEKAVKIIKKAIAENKKIAIYGDYDADGVTSVSVLKTALKRLGADVFFMIPNRFEHGYGPNKELFQDIYEYGASLIITVDNGVSGVEEVAFAKSLGMEVIITDHHEAGEVWPEADAILHPRHPNGDYPFKDLAGVGVAYKLASALLETPPTDLLELVAIGTVADLVPLRGENRYFVKTGVEQMRKSKRPGILALIRNASTEQSQVTEETIGFMIGPRLNAAGRLGDADPAVDLLMTEDLTIATGLAEALDGLNKERQSIVATIAQEAEDIIEEMYGNTVPSVYVLAKEGWNPGVVGIVASRLTDKYYRPSILLAIDPETGMAKGSARSIEGFNMYEELTKNASILPHFGGHPMAAGLSLRVDDLSTLRDNLNRQGEAVMTEDQLIPKLSIDVPLSLDEIDVDVLEKLELLRPFGMDFAKPVYMLENLAATSVRKIGAAQNHMKLELTDSKTTLDVIGFGLGEIADHITPGIELSVAGDLQVNEWNGNKKTQLLLKDILSNDWQLFDLRGIREVSRWLHTIPAENATFLAFNQRTIDALQSPMNGVQIQLYGMTALTKNAPLVLLDIPSEESTLLEVMCNTNPDRIYAHFYVPESKYFDGLPGRDQFGWYYSFLKSRGSFDINENGSKLTKHKGWRNDTVHFMTQVFFELGFVKIEDGMIIFTEAPVKRALPEAPTYQKRERQIELEKKLLYAPYTELKQWFDRMRNGAIVEEEQV